MEDNWFRLLQYWQKIEWHHALTIPFLIGAHRTPIGSPFSTEEEAISAVSVLLDGVRNHNADDYHFLIYRCPDLKKLVIRQVDGINYMHGFASQFQIPTSSGGEPVLYVDKDDLTVLGGSVLDDLVAEIWSESGEAIKLGKYSCHK